MLNLQVDSLHPLGELNPLVTPIDIDKRDISSRTADYLFTNNIPDALKAAFVLWIPSSLLSSVSAVIANRSIVVTQSETYGTLMRKHERTLPIKDQLTSYLQRAMSRLGINVNQLSLPVNSVLRIVDDPASSIRQGQLVPSTDYKPSEDVIYLNTSHIPRTR